MPVKSSGAAALRSGETRGPKGRAGDIAAPILSTEALDDRIAIVGTAGSGKTYAAKDFVERLLASGARVAIVDPLGVWWGLRASADGAAPGYPVVVFGGRHADVPITAEMAAALGRLIAGQALACVVDLSDLGSSAARRRFMAAFAEALYEANERAAAPRPGRGGPMGAAAADQRLGRPLGSYREDRAARSSARLYPVADYAAAGGRTQGRAEPGRYPDRDEADGKPGSRRDRGLDRGAGRSAGRQAHPRRITAPQAGGGVSLGARPRPPAAGAISRDPDLRQLAHAQAWRAACGAADACRCGSHGDRRRARGGRDWGYGQGARRSHSGNAVAGRSCPSCSARAGAGGRESADCDARGRKPRARFRLAEIAALARASKEALPISAPASAPISETKPPHSPRVGANAKSSDGPRTEVRGGRHPAGQKLLTALAQHAPARFTWGQAATLAGLKPSGRHFNAGRKELRDAGYVAETGGLVTPTPDGLNAAGEVPAAPSTPAERLTLWCDRLPSPAPEMLRTLAAQGERYIDAGDLAKALGKKPTGRHWNSGIAILRNNGLIETEPAVATPGSKRYRAAALFRN